MNFIQAFFIGAVSTAAGLIILGFLFAWWDNKVKAKEDLGTKFARALKEQQLLRNLRIEYVNDLVSLINAQFPNSTVTLSWEGNVCTVIFKRDLKCENYCKVAVTFGEMGVELPSGEVDKLATKLALRKIDMGDK